jgi:hypothetical protein
MLTEPAAASLKTLEKTCQARTVGASEHQLRVLMLACARRVQYLVPSAALHQLVDQAEQAVDSRAVSLPSHSHQPIQELLDQGYCHGSPVVLAAYVCLWAAAPMVSVWLAAYSVTTGWQAEWGAGRAEDDRLPARGRRARRRALRDAWLALLDDILPDPALTLDLEPGWRTPLIASLLGNILDERDYSLTPILADALEDGGCCCTALLEHLRWHPVHGRGCWALQRLRSARVEHSPDAVHEEL